MTTHKPSILTIATVGSGTLIVLLLALLYLAEAVLFFTRPETKSEALASVRTTSERAFPAVTPQVILLRGGMRGFGHGPAELIPLGGVSHANTVFCREAGDMITYKSDRYGFRNEDALWDKPVDVVAIGDSFTQGACVSDQDHFAGSLRSRYGNVLNLGSFGNGPYANLAVLTEYALDRKPDIVLWFYVANDMAIDMGLEEGNRVLTQYLRLGFTQHLTKRQPEIDQALAPFLDVEWNRQKEEESRAKPELLTLGHVRQSLRITLRDALRPPAPDLPAEFDYDRQNRVDYQKHAFILAQAASRARQAGSHFVFVIVPDARMLRPNVEEAKSPAKHVEKLKANVAAMGIPVIDLYDVVTRTESPEKLYAPLDGYYGHFDAAGYRQVGKALVKQLERVQGLARVSP